jgi:hypothetical protein
LIYASSIFDFYVAFPCGMYLLSFSTADEVVLTEFVGHNIPRYAILSHTWGLEEEEVSFKDLIEDAGKRKAASAGYNKIIFCGKQAQKHGIEYFWVDSCCIDRRSSADLSEAINSMFRWYSKAEICYTYLSDVSVHEPDSEIAFRNSRWFTRGWTLQELIAPASLEFFSREGELLGDKKSLERQLYDITGIAPEALQGGPLSQFTIEQRMTWAKNRKTKREEDQAYCLLGLFDVSMPLIYGEGEAKALIRLKRLISEGVKGISLFTTDKD